MKEKLLGHFKKVETLYRERRANCPESTESYWNGKINTTLEAISWIKDNVEEEKEEETRSVQLTLKEAKLIYTAIHNSGLPDLSIDTHVCFKLKNVFKEENF